MKEQAPPEASQFHEKLVTVVAGDFPDAREVVVSFPDEWQLVRAFRDWRPCRAIRCCEAPRTDSSPRPRPAWARKGDVWSSIPSLHVYRLPPNITRQPTEEEMAERVNQIDLNAYAD